MEVPINEKYRITTDAHNYIVQCRGVGVRKDTGKPNWSNVGYWATLEGALKGYCEHRQRVSSVKGWDNLQKLLKSLYGEIQAISETLKITVTMNESEK